MATFKIFVINVGSTSTKVAYYEDESCVIKDNITHPVSETNKFEDVMDQREYRRDVILKFMEDNSLDLREMDAVVSRGGHTAPLTSGTFLITPLMLDQIKSGLYGRHASDVGPSVAYDMCQGVKATPMVADTPCSDEFLPIAKLSGHPLFPRQVRFHALSHKATARRYAADLGVSYDTLNLITIHMGGGITLAAHENGLMIDGNNGIEGEGPYSTNRTGGLMAQYIVDACFSGKYTKKEIGTMINGQGGLLAYLGESDVLTVIKMAETDEYAKLCLEGMFYQTCKEAGALATVLRGKIDAILITGGMAYGESIIEYMKDRLSFLGKIAVYPGENEMQSLALGALYALRENSLLKKLKEEN